MTDEAFIPFARPDISNLEIESVVETLRAGWLTSGPKVRLFEEAFAERVGARHAIAVNSGTAAMHLALEAIGIGPGDKVLTTDYTFTATAEVVRYFGADPIFVDVDPATLNISVADVEQHLKRDSSIKSLMPVHFAGQACDMERLVELCAEYEVPIVEDAAHAFPTTVNGQTIGSIGTATAFSFYATKTLAVGEGGMLTSDDDEIASRARVMRLHGISRDVFDRYTSAAPAWYYEVIAPGFKYNLSDIAAAIGIHQLQRAEEMHARREAIANAYMKSFADLPLTLPNVRVLTDTHAWHLFVVQLRLEELTINRAEFIQAMSHSGVGTSVHFIPLHRQPYWRDTYQLDARDFPFAEAAYQRAVSLPLFSAMTEHEVCKVIAAVREILIRFSR